MTTWRLGSVLIVLVTAGAGVADVTVWREADGGNGHAYEVIRADVTWEEARALAYAMVFEGVPGHLATSISEGEDDFIESLLTDEHYVWLGGIQPDPEVAPDAGWAWLAGDEWGFTDWKSGEPNDASGTALESYLGMWGPNGQLLGKWNDFAGEVQQGPGPNGFVVEYTPCTADLNGDQIVDTGDLLLVLAQWGECPPKCPGDLDGDGTVSTADMLNLLALWGRCFPGA